MKKNRIIFVDDEKNVLNGLRRLLSVMRKSWEMEFAEGSSEALSILAEKPFDIIVADIRMPGMDGIELLEKVKVSYPHMTRIILSGHADQENLLKSTRIAHQFLAKPCTIESLKSCISNISDLQNTLEEQSVKNLISNISTLPSIPSSYNAIMEEIRSPQSSMKRVGEIIKQDLSMAAKILQLVNSAFFGLPRKISNPYDAACLLGIDIVKTLVLAIGVFSQFNNKSMAHFSLDQLFEHGLLTGSLAIDIARFESMDKETSDNIFMSALFHDIGKLVLAQNFPRQYDALLKLVAEKNADLSKTEKRVFGADHGMVGGYLMGLWGFSRKAAQSVVFHHDPSKFQDVEFGAVYAANLFAHNCSNNKIVLSERDKRVINDLELLHRFESWENLCRSAKGLPESNST